MNNLIHKIELMNSTFTLCLSLLFFGCSGILQEKCQDTQADPISEFDRSFLPYTQDSIYEFKDLTTNNIVTLNCDTVYEFWQSIFMDGDCDFYAHENIRKVILSRFPKGSEDELIIALSIRSRKFNSSFSYYSERNNYREFLIDIQSSKTGSVSYYHFSSYIVKSSPNLTYYNTGGPLAESSFAFYDTKSINGLSYNNVNEIICLNPITSSWTDTLYINNEFGILKLKTMDLNHNLVFNQ